MKVRKTNNNSVLRLGFIGRFTPVKGAHILIECIKKLKHPERVELHLYGSLNDIDSENYLNSLIKYSEVCKNIYFHGELRDEDRVKAYSNLDIIAVPSLWFENLPFVILESFAIGIPVIASDIEGITELVDHNINGILVETGDVNSWCDAIDKIANNPKILNKLTNGIPNIISSVQASAETVKLFDKVLSN